MTVCHCTEIEQLRAELAALRSREHRANSADDRIKLVALLKEELDWKWGRAPNVPSADDVLKPVADVILAAGFTRSREQKANT